MRERKPACSEPGRSKQSRTGQVCMAGSVGRTDGPVGGERESRDGKRFWQLPGDTVLVFTAGKPNREISIAQGVSL